MNINPYKNTVNPLKNLYKYVILQLKILPLIQVILIDHIVKYQIGLIEAEINSKSINSVLLTNS